MELKADKIIKTFGEKLVLDNINLTANSGAALGLLGPNGAGKTTLIRIIMGVFPPNSGNVTVDGKKISKSDVTFGYLPEERGLYPKQKILVQMEYIGVLRGLDRKQSKKNAEYWLEMVDMIQHKNDLLSTLSKGNQQKIQLAVTLINNPDIVILDEPFSGLDPVNAQLLKNIVTEQVSNGKIVIFSSHQMSYVEEFCDNIVLINKGRTVLEGNLRQIKRSYERNKIRVCLDGGDTHVKINKMLENNDLKSNIKSVNADDDAAIVNLNSEDFRQNLLSSILNSGYSVETFNVVEPTLEQIFVERVGQTNEEQ